MISRLFIIIMFAGIISCSADKDTDLAKSNEPGAERVELSDPAQFSAEAHSSLHITPLTATARSLIKLQASADLLAEGTVTWLVNDIIDETVKGTRYTSTKLRKRDILQAMISMKDQEYYSNKIVINNTPPRIVRATISPSTLKTGDSVSASINSSDEDNDPLTFIYSWKINGLFAGEEEYLQGDIAKGDLIELEVRPFDGEAYGVIIRLSSTVENSLPVLKVGAPSLQSNQYSTTVSATDPDGDYLTYELENNPEGMTIDSDGLIIWDVPPESEGVYEFKVKVTDGSGGMVILPLSTTISLLNDAPAK